MINPQRPNWRGQRPRIDPSPLPTPKFKVIEDEITYWTKVRVNRVMIHDETSKQIDPVPLVPLFNKCPKHIAVIIAQRQISGTLSSECLEIVFEARLKTLINS